MRFLFLLSLLLFFHIGHATCRDRDAWAASDALAQSFFKEVEVFRQARVLKVHHPSRRKEVASYIKAGERRYSIFTLVDEECRATFRKRTRQRD
jgi:hypothetical protein